MSQSPVAVFISYASEDAAAAESIAEALKAAGLEVWFDRAELRGGDAWDQNIREQIQNCRLFLALVSANTNARDEGYFRREWHLAADRMLDMDEKKPFLFPVVIDGTVEKHAAVPGIFRRVQWTRLPDGKTTSAFLTRVLSLSSAPSAGDSPSKPLAPSITVPHSTRRFARLATSIALVLLLGALSALSWRWLTGTKTDQAPEKSVAVLPFQDLSEKHDQQYVADGMADEILNLLAGIPGLKVIGRTSSFSFKGQSVDLKTIGKTLGAAYLLEGSVRRFDDHIRVSAQLIDTRDGVHRWSETFDGDTARIFQLQNEIAARIASAMHATIATWSLPQRRSVDPQAYDLFARGNLEVQSLSEAGLDRGLALLQQALAIDPHFSDAATAIAYAYESICVDGLKDHRAVCEEGLRAAERAITLNPRSPDAYSARAELRTVFEWNWAGAEQDLNQAESLGGGENFDFAFARLSYAVGRMDAARLTLDRLLTRSPLDANAMWDRGYMVEYRSGQFAEAERWIRRSNQMLPESNFGHFALAEVLLAQGKNEEALKEILLEPDKQASLVGCAIAYHALGRIAEADQALAEAVKQAGGSRNADLARVYSFRGDRDRAFQLLDVAYSKKDSELWYVKGDWLFSNLKSDPRWSGFLHKMNLSE